MSPQPVSRTLTTAEDLLAMGEGRRELIEGVVSETEPASGDHGRVAWEIGGLLRDYAREHGGVGFAAETGFRLGSDPDTVRAPDAAYVTAEHASRVGRSPGYWPGAPDLVAEVVSPRDSFSAVHSKALTWLAAGARVVLVCDPQEQTVTRYRAADDVTVHTGSEPVDCAPAIPGFAPAAAELLGGAWL